MNPINIRTGNGAKHNGQVDFRYQRVQNRATAVSDACEEFGESLDIDIVCTSTSIRCESNSKRSNEDKKQVTTEFFHNITTSNENE